MTEYEINCPICVSSGSLPLNEKLGVYLVEGFKQDPAEGWKLRNRPKATHGEKLYLEDENKQRFKTTCENSHTLRVYAAKYVHVPPSKTIYEPQETPEVRCPNCKYKFGNHEEFIKLVDDSDPSSNHILRSISYEKPPDHQESKSLTRSDCTDFERIAKLEMCPNCGEQLFFNYRNKDVDDSREHFSGFERID